MLENALYFGHVMHHRQQPKVHRFRYPLAMICCNIAELETCFQHCKLISNNRFNLLSLQRKQHYGDNNLPLYDSIIQLLQQETVQTTFGSIYLLTLPSYLGYAFKPISYYFVFAQQTQQLTHVILEVSNTPWQQQYCYVLNTAANSNQATQTYTFAKQLHVSPFLPMNMHYEMKLSLQAEQIQCVINNYQQQQCVHTAVLQLQKKPLQGRNLDKLYWHYTLQTQRVIFRIYWQALRLWCKKVPFYPHPDKNRS